MVGKSWLSAFCGDDEISGIKESVFNLSRNSSVPDFSVCCQNTLMVWIPDSFVCFCCLLWSVCLCRMKTFNIRRSYFNIFKMVICFLLFIVYLVNLIRSSVGHYSTNGISSSVKYALQSTTTLLLLFTTWFEYKKRIHSSCAVSVSWLVLVLSGLVELRSRIINVVEHDTFQTVSYFISFLLIFVEFLCCFFSDLSVLREHPLAGPTSEDKKSNKVLKQCPEERACFFARVSFFWISGLMWKGYRKALTYDDLFDLREVDRSDVVVPRFEKLWQEEVDRVKDKLGNSRRTLNSSNNQNMHNSIIYDNNNTSSGKNNHNNSNKTNAKKLQNSKSDEESIQMLPTSRSNESTETKTETKTKTRVSDLKKGVSLARVVARMFGWPYLLGGMMKLIYDLIAFLLPLLLNFLILFIKSPTSPTWLGMLVVLAMFSVSYLRTLLIQQYWHVCFVVGQHLRTAVVGAVYRKALRLSNTARRGATVGEIVNLMSIDAQKFDDASQFLHMTWSTPLIIAISVYMLWQFLGPSVLAGLLCMMLVIPVNGYIATRTKKLQVEQMKFKDSRVKMIAEILNGIKVLKLYAWEEFFSSNVASMRSKEIKVLRTAQLLSSASAISWFMTPFFVALSTFTVYVKSSPENILDTNKAFVSLSLFNMLNYPISILPMVINSLVQVSVSTKRLKNFLLEEELNKYVKEDGCLNDENAVEIENASFSWGNDDNYVLKDINVNIRKGQLVAVVGQVGCGKSSFVNAICGEMDVCTGSVRTKGTIAYVAQQAWIQNATIRDNIVFSRKYSTSIYKKVVNACALKPDFQVLPGSDETEVGEKGINLSGGQKQRLSLARALYQNADIYLLDDPMASVDTHVGEHIFNEVVGRNGLLQKKTRILVTNQVSLLPHVDLILVLKDGFISEMGTYQDLMNRKSPFTEFVQQHLKTPKERVVLDEGFKAVPSASSETAVDTRRRLLKSISSSVSEDGNQKDEGKARLMTEEIAMTGNIKLSVISRYIKASRVVPAVSFLIFYSFYAVSHVSGGLWLSLWSNSPPSNDTSVTNYWVGVYGSFGIGQVIGVMGLTISLAILCTRCSENLHRSLLESLLRAPTSFFDTTPQGRIVNRFSRDVDILDVVLPLTLRIWFGTMAGVIATFFVICYTIPVFMAVLVPLSIFYYFVQRFYISTSRELRRLDSNFRSPIYAHFGETVVGCSSIRAYGVQGRFIATSDELVNRSLVTSYPIIISNRWLGILVESVGIATLVLCAMFVVLQKETIDAGLAGLSMSCSMQITLTLNVFVRTMSELETNIVSVERIDEYINCPHEAPARTSVSPPATWPESGRIEFIDYSTRYRENLDLTLKDFSCVFNPGEKVGIVGRTGAGKSSLALALFRIIEAASGSIVIDDVAIATLGLYDLRSRLTIIPQDPVLFSGPLRMNIDPSGLRTDDEIWDVLRHASLQNFVAGLPEKLMTMCTEGGGNLSVGQRQLICLARALLRKTNILILDEATASIDLESDALIQKTIRNEFNRCTVVTIAHRLNTIVDYDRILVLEEGRLAEFDSPKNLLSNDTSHFYKMAKSANLVS